MSNTAKRHIGGRRQHPPDKDTLELFRRPPPAEAKMLPPVTPEGRSSPSTATSAPDEVSELDDIFEGDDQGGHRIARFHARRR